MRVINTRLSENGANFANSQIRPQKRGHVLVKRNGLVILGNRRGARDNGNHAAMRLRLETHEFHNYCIMLQDGTYTCVPVRSSVRPPSLLVLLFDSYLRARARLCRAGGRERLRRDCVILLVERSLTVFFFSEAFTSFSACADVRARKFASNARRGSIMVPPYYVSIISPR